MRALQTAPVLRLFNEENVLIYLLTDSSSIAYSSLLAQGYLIKDKDASTFKVRLFPVAYGGRSFSASEQNWSSSRLECAGLARSIGNHADLLRSCVFSLGNDNLGAFWLLKQASPTDRSFMNIYLSLCEFTFESIYIKENQNFFCDYYSRNPNKTEPDTTNTLKINNMQTENFTHDDLLWSQ